MSCPSRKADRGVKAVRYAVLMKVHYWDDFTERRLWHLIRKVVIGDVIFVSGILATPNIPLARRLMLTKMADMAHSRNSIG